MLRSMVLVAMIAVLLVGAGAAGWVAYSLRRAVMDGALPAQTKALEYAVRSLAFRVEQQQKPLHMVRLQLYLLPRDRGARACAGSPCKAL